MAVLVFANGDVDNVRWIAPYLKRAVFVIAADGGVRHLKALEHVPDLVIGDLDSLSTSLERWLADSRANLAHHPADKDETDLEMAMLHAARHHAGEILVFGVLGGRLDQTLANILLLAHPQLRGRAVQYVTEHERAWLIESETTIPGQVGDKVSLVPLGGDVRVRATSGLRWPLHNEVLSFGQARGISNEMTAGVASVRIDTGLLLCIHTEGTWRR